MEGREGGRERGGKGIFKKQILEKRTLRKQTKKNLKVKTSITAEAMEGPQISGVTKLLTYEAPEKGEC